PVFKLKHDEKGTPVQFKAWYVCQGQDYTKTSSPTTRLESFQVLAHLGASL
ncbi:hypothetical protein BDR05DRAFT_865553, partial [Suillus weaverae]